MLDKLKIYYNSNKNIVIQNLCISFIIINILCSQIKQSTIKEDDSTQKFLEIYWNINKILVILFIYILPKPYIKRPLPIIWQIVQSFTLVYLINLLILVLLNYNTIKKILYIIDNNLLNIEDLSEKDYAQDCRIFTFENEISYFYNIYSSLDVYILCHSIGWFIKSFVFRNIYLTWMMSILFEIMELTFRYYLKNFNECWWDHLFLDLFGMNLLGIVLAHYIIKKYNLKLYHWFIDKPITFKGLTLKQRKNKFIECIDDYNKNNKWHVFGNLKNYLIILYLVAINIIIDLSNFFNKFVFNIPSDHFLLKYRIFIVGFGSILTFSEIYLYIKEKNINRKRYIMMYISNLIILCELILFFKNVDYSKFHSKIPNYILFLWSIAGIILIGFGVFSYKNGIKKTLNK